jgi:hypothetical protein
MQGDMIKCVMIQLCRGLFGLSYLVLYVLSCYLIFGLTATLIIVGVQLLLTGWLVWTMIRAPD